MREIYGYEPGRGCGMTDRCYDYIDLVHRMRDARRAGDHETVSLLRGQAAGLKGDMSDAEWDYALGSINSMWETRRAVVVKAHGDGRSAEDCYLG